MEQMQTMTKSYGIKAVGRAAAATVMLPLALGVDLIILPGPQVWLRAYHVCLLDVVWYPIPVTHIFNWFVITGFTSGLWSAYCR